MTTLIVQRKQALEKVRAQLPSTDCIAWPGNLTRDGYGPHRRVYQTLVGPIPDGLQIDHLCRVRHCVNPAHLEPVTQAENNFRRLVAKYGGVKSHCGWPEFTGRVR